MLGPFRIDAPLGRGGMGAVLRGRHAPSGVPVAIKVVDGEQAWRPSFQEAFRNEIRAVAALDHPHVVRVYDHGVAEEALPEHGVSAGAPYLAMELASDGTLADVGASFVWPAVDPATREARLLTSRSQPGTCPRA